MLTLDEIIWGYRYVLDREPLPDEVSGIAMQAIGRSDFREFLLRSDEFVAREKVIGRHSKWVITEIFNGETKMWIDLADRYVSFGCLIDNYEPLETTAFKRLIQPGFHVVDLGANVGWFSLLAARCAGADGRVWAVEPRHPTVDYLRRSVQLNGLEDRISVLPMAVGDRSGTVSLIWDPASRNPGSTHIGDPGGGAEVQSVEMQELDRLLAGVRVDCIKMDIEGAEGLALAGAGELLREHRPFILCEINPAALRYVSAMSVADFATLVRARGYALFSLQDHTGLARLNGVPDLGDQEIINVVLAHEARSPEQV